MLRRAVVGTSSGFRLNRHSLYPTQGGFGSPARAAKGGLGLILGGERTFLFVEQTQLQVKAHESHTRQIQKYFHSCLHLYFIFSNPSAVEQLHMIHFF